MKNKMNLGGILNLRNVSSTSNYSQCQNMPIVQISIKIDLLISNIAFTVQASIANGTLKVVSSQFGQNIMHCIQ